MTPERRRQIAELAEAAQHRDLSIRAAFLDEACAGDPALRGEVDHLLSRAGHDQAESFVVDPATANRTTHAPLLTFDRTAQSDQVSIEPPPRPRSLRWIGALSAMVLGVFSYAGWTLALKGGSQSDLGWTEMLVEGQWRVAAVRAEPVQSQLAAGDRIVSLEGVAPFPAQGTLFHRGRLHPGEPYTVTVQRGTEVRTVNLVAGRGPSVLAVRVSYYVTSFLWCVIGLLIGAARPDLAVARLAMAVSVAVGLVFLDAGVIQIGTLWAPLHVVLGYHFFARFPTGALVTGGWRVVLWLLYAIGGIAGAINVAFEGLVFLAGWRAAAAFPVALMPVSGITGLIGFTGSIAAMLAVVPRNYRRLSSEDQRRRVRWVFYATLVALIPEVWYSGVALFERFVGPSPVPRFDLAANTVPIIVPISVAYAVIKHRVFDITVAIRLGVQYVLARRALQALMALPVVALALTLVVNRDRTLSAIATESTGYLYWIVAAGLVLKFRKPIRAWLDRRFFREEFDREQVLIALVDDISRANSIGDVSRLVRDKLALAVHPKTQLVWYRDPSDSAIASSSNPELTPPDFPAGRWLDWLERHGEVVELPLPSVAALTRREAQWLDDRRIRLLVPIADSRDRLVGVLLLGEKRSEEPYSATDRRLLYGVARQAAVARENLRLRAKVSEDARIRHDVLARLDSTIPDLLKECPGCGACFDGSATVCAHDGQPLTLSLPVSRTVEGKYRLDRLIGRGGMGAVYEARDLRLDRSVAVKIMLGRAFGQEDALRRFHREARAAASLNHPNIVSVYDFGPLEREGAYLVMERLAGRTLRSVLKETPAMGPSEIAEWFDPLLRGLAAAHDQSIVHRDLKPENVVGERVKGRVSSVKILDFGLAKFQSGQATGGGTLTMPGAVMGTLGYMSPEQLLGGDVDHRTDIFAVGVMLVEALTGRQPFRGDTAGELSRSVLHDTVLLPRTLESSAVDAIVQKCLAKDANKRFDSAEMLRRELMPALTRASQP